MQDPFREKCGFRMFTPGAPLPNGAVGRQFLPERPEFSSREFPAPGTRGPAPRGRSMGTSVASPSTHTAMSSLPTVGTPPGMSIGLPVTHTRAFCSGSGAPMALPWASSAGRAGWPLPAMAMCTFRSFPTIACSDSHRRGFRLDSGAAVEPGPGSTGSRSSRQRISVFVQAGHGREPDTTHQGNQRNGIDQRSDGCSRTAK